MPTNLLAKSICIHTLSHQGFISFLAYATNSDTAYDAVLHHAHTQLLKKWRQVGFFFPKEDFNLS